MAMQVLSFPKIVLLHLNGSPSAPMVTPRLSEHPVAALLASVFLSSNLR